jgi:hypothetical protein
MIISSRANVEPFVAAVVRSGTAGMWIKTLYRHGYRSAHRDHARSAGRTDCVARHVYRENGVRYVSTYWR